MRAAVSTPTTKTAPGSTWAFSRNVGARVSSTVPRQLNCSSRRRTSTAASAGLSAFTTDSSNVTGPASISLATRASSRCPAWSGLNEPASTPRRTGALGPERRSARASARRAMATAVSALHACSGSWPRKSTRASGLYGTMASTRVREPPGTRRSSAIAPLPPPVTARTTRRPEAWTRSTIVFIGPMSIVQYRSCAASAHEGMEALAGDQAPRFDCLEPGVSELRDQLGPPREAAAALGHRRPEIEDVDAGALSLAEGRQQQPAAGPDESAHMTQDPHPVLDREVVDVVVQRREVEGGLGGARHDVARLDRDAPRETPGGDVLGRQGGDLWLELQAEGRQLGVTPCGVAGVDRRPAADLEEPNRARARHDVVDRLAHERLDEARRAGHEPAVLIREREAAPRAQARRRLEEPDAVEPRGLFGERGGRGGARIGERPRGRPAQPVAARPGAELAEPHADPEPGLQPVAHRGVGEEPVGEAIEREGALGEPPEEPARRAGGEEDEAGMTSHRARRRERQPELAAAEEGEEGAELHRAHDPSRRP